MGKMKKNWKNCAMAIIKIDGNINSKLKLQMYIFKL